MNMGRVIALVVFATAPPLLGDVSQAADVFEFSWRHYSYMSRGSCANATLVQEGDPFFDVNQTPIPTFTISGSPIQYPNGDREGMFEAPFNGSILRVGSNVIDFAVAVQGGSHCDISDHLISLRNSSGLDRTLFTIQLRGTEFRGSTTASLSLREIDAQLADDVDRWKRQLDDDLRALETAGQEQADYLSRLRRLETLDGELDELFDEGFGEVSPSELQALLDSYVDILSPEAQAALVDVLSSFRRDIEELRTELDRINSDLASQSDMLNSAIDSAGGRSGFDLGNPSNFTPQSDPGGLPTVAMPLQSGNDPFDPANDPYAAMAVSVTAAVQATLDGQGVRDRAAFLQLFASWRRNVSDIETGFLHRAWISQREYSAFLNGRHRVLALFRVYLDDDGWLRDSPIPDGIKPLIDLLIVLRMEEQASSLKIALNEWRGQLSARQLLILDAIRAMRAAIEARKAELARQQDEQQAFWPGLVANAVVVVRSAVLALTPVGDFVDFCEIITGRELCLPDGRELSVTERMLSGAGMVAGSGQTWRAIAGTVRKSEKVTKKLSDIYDELRILTPRKGITKTVPLPGGGKRFHHQNGLQATFDKDGFPDFREYVKTDLGPGQKAVVNIELSGSRSVDARLANAEAKFPKTPDGYVWHHDKKLGRMLLIREDVHDAFRHTGGVAIWQKIMGREYQ